MWARFTAWNASAAFCGATHTIAERWASSRVEVTRTPRSSAHWKIASCSERVCSTMSRMPSSSSRRTEVFMPWKSW